MCASCDALVSFYESQWSGRTLLTRCLFSVLHFALFAMDCVELLRCRRAAALALPASGVSLDTVKDVDRGYSSHSSA